MILMLKRANDADVFGEIYVRMEGEERSCTHGAPLMAIGGRTPQAEAVVIVSATLEIEHLSLAFGTLHIGDSQ